MNRFVKPWKISNLLTSSMQEKLTLKSQLVNTKYPLQSYVHTE